MLNIKEVEQQDIKLLYETHFVNDFHHADILRPYERMMKLISDRKYVALGYYSGSELCAYTFSAIKEKVLFIDFFAVMNGMRGTGIGSSVLCALSQAYPEYAIVLEVENPEFSLDEQDKDIRENRIHFYRKNGFETINLKLSLFGDPYLIMTKGVLKDEVQAFYILNTIYENLYTKEIAEKNIVLSVKLKQTH